MTNPHTIYRLATELRQAASIRNWALVMQVDQHIASLLSGLQGATLSPAQSKAIDVLQTTHRQVNAWCHQQSDVLREKMEQTRNNRERAAAYATFMDEKDLG
ncbi:hypothetical protein [Mangrovibacter yixingensis]|uniref:hypothetical protein n=1 Tax=Mangrovibacter yixingensis TaxID=1529639 RepID=UPI001CFE136B|nr:hypothetical protein [Mangrovibacter yixingensis]